MNRAASVFASWFREQFASPQFRLIIFCGPGNNGGDGVAVARLLQTYYTAVEVHLLRIGSSLSEDLRNQLELLKAHPDIPVREIESGDVLEPPSSSEKVIVIDAIFGSGLNRPVEGYWADLIEKINSWPLLRVSIDIPSGMFADKFTSGVSVMADHCLSFQFPKLAFFFAENEERVKSWDYCSIGLHPGKIEQLETENHYLDGKFAYSLIKKRKRFDHKGNYGHARIIAGSLGKIGAAILSCNACLRAGAGLVTAYIPKCGYTIMQISSPECMVEIDPHDTLICRILPSAKFNAEGIGPGIGKNEITFRALKSWLPEVSHPLVIDADALNLISAHPELWDDIPEKSILTPHPGEFRRLAGDFPDPFERHRRQLELSQKHRVYVLLKGAHSCLTTPGGKAYFNSTGNPGMATAGSGDVLLGVITGLLAQGYSPLESATLGMFIHGLAGDLASDALGHESLIAGDIIDHLGLAFMEIRENDVYE